MQSLDQHQGNIPGDNTLDSTFAFIPINSSAITDQSNSNEGSPSQSPAKIARPYGGLFLPAIQPSICFRPAGTNDHSLLSASTQTTLMKLNPPPKVTHEDLHQLNTSLTQCLTNSIKHNQTPHNSIDKNTSNIQFVKKLVLETYKRNQKYLHNIEHNLLDQSNDIKDIKQSFNDLNLIFELSVN